jgi:penicillin-binding protein A
MLKPSKLHHGFQNGTAQWREFQNGLRKQSARQRTMRRIPGYILGLFVLILLTHGFFRLLERYPVAAEHAAVSSGEADGPAEIAIAHTDILQGLSLANATSDTFGLVSGELDYEITTSLMPAVQEYIIDRIDRKNSLYFGFVIMEPDTGRIVSMISHDRLDPDNNVCVNAGFPAASIFKIIAAAAAIETKRYQPDTPMVFNGNKYTLYRNQLTRVKNRHSSTILFGDAFAKSVNPVFGNIGMHDLDKETLAFYGEAFGFNRSPQFELCMQPSSLVIKDEPYHWAEIASGFNRTTLMSPLHGAMIVAVFLNNGQWVEPRIIDKIRRGSDTIYRGRAGTGPQVIQPGTAAALKKMMESTVRSGTAAKTFRGASRDKTLSLLTIGGKTGSINDRPDFSIRYDLFTGFAEKKDGTRQIAISVFVAHKDFIGTRAAQYARLGIKKYYETITYETPSKQGNET